MATIEYDELAASLKKYIVVDVRSKEEVNKSGNIPGANFVPFSEFDSAWELNGESFSSKYGFQKPSKDDTVITHCMFGGRAGKAQAALKEKGYNRARCYAGSFKDWMEKGGEIQNKP